MIKFYLDLPLSVLLGILIGIIVAWYFLVRIIPSSFSNPAYETWLEMWESARSPWMWLLVLVPYGIFLGFLQPAFYNVFQEIKYSSLFQLFTYWLRESGNLQILFFGLTLWITIVFAVPVFIKRLFQTIFEGELLMVVGLLLITPFSLFMFWGAWTVMALVVLAGGLVLVQVLSGISVIH